MIRLAVAALSLLIVSPAAAAGDFAQWATLVIAGDNHAAHTNETTKTFDNARRDVAALLVSRGFAPANVITASVGSQPASAAQMAFNAFAVRARVATAGCLIYVTSHGAPGVIVVGDGVLTPAHLAAAIHGACGQRPTAVVLSACYSGSFVPALRASNRLVITAARRDRSSFGCGEADKYPYFDGCVIEAAPFVVNLIDMANRARACVVRRETEEGLRPASEPQIVVGADFQRESPNFSNPNP